MKKITDRTMILFHVTPAENWNSIGVQGLLKMYSLNRREKLGLVTRSMVVWAVGHTMDKFGVESEDLIVVTVRVRRSTLKRNKMRGVWYSLNDIYPCRIVRIEELDIFDG